MGSTTAETKAEAPEITWTRVEPQLWVARSRRRRYAGSIEAGRSFHASDAHGYPLGDHLRITAARHEVERRYAHPRRGAALLCPLGMLAAASGVLALASAIAIVTASASF